MRPITFARGALLAAGIAMATGCTSTELAASTPRPTPAAAPAPAPEPVVAAAPVVDHTQAMTRAGRLWNTASEDLFAASEALDAQDLVSGCRLINRAHDKATQAMAVVETIPASTIEEVETMTGVDMGRLMGQIDGFQQACAGAGF